jgi:hypothetical protein
MNQSFWNKLAGAKSKTLACTVVAALTVALLFMVCSKDEETPCPSTQAGCPGYVNPCPSTQAGCPGYVNPCDADPSAQGCPGYCPAHPTAPECQSDPCLTNPTPDCDNYCQFFPNATQCRPVDNCETNPTPGCPGYVNPCDADPSAQGCPGYCQTHPSEPECLVDGCATNPTWPDCDNFCQFYPNASQCQVVETCETNPTMYGCPGYCDANPGAPECNTDPCVINPYAQGCPQFCDVNPQAAECSNDPCVADPYGLGCPLYCVTHQTDPLCTGGGGDKEYCYWAANNGTCVEIGNAWCEEASCATAAGCIAASGKVSSYSDCHDVAVTGTIQYCYWGPGECWPMAYPNDPDPNNAGMTVLQACEAYGFVSNSTTCDDYVAPAQEYYCYWGGTTGCSKIQNPNSPSSNAGLTNLENCVKNSQPEQSFPTLAACQAWTPPAVQEFCNWGPCEGPTADGYGCASGGCYIKKPSDTCTGTNLVTSCPAGTKPPNANY